MTAEDPTHTALTPSSIPGEASAAVAPVAVWASLGPETGTPREGLDARKSAPHRVLHPPEGSAEATDGSVWSRIKNLFSGPSILSNVYTQCHWHIAHTHKEKPSCSIITWYNANAIKTSG